MNHNTFTNHIPKLKLALSQESAVYRYVPGLFCRST